RVRFMAPCVRNRSPRPALGKVLSNERRIADARPGVIACLLVSRQPEEITGGGLTPPPSLNDRNRKRFQGRLAKPNTNQDTLCKLFPYMKFRARGSEFMIPSRLAPCSGNSARRLRLHARRFARRSWSSRSTTACIGT